MDDVNCDFTELTGSTETFFEQSKKAIGNRRVLPVAACQALDESRWGGLKPVYDVAFIAPARWGFAPDHEAWLYQSDARASNIWKRETYVKVIGVAEDGPCGRHTLAEDEVCVHAQLARAFFGDECAAANTSPTPTLGIAQSEGTDGKIFTSPLMTCGLPSAAQVSAPNTSPSCTVGPWVSAVRSFAGHAAGVAGFGAERGASPGVAVVHATRQAAAAPSTREIDVSGVVERNGCVVIGVASW